MPLRPKPPVAPAGPVTWIASAAPKVPFAAIGTLKITGANVWVK
jgi:hypothetical protein